MFRQAAAALGADSSRTAMLGDAISSDVLAAQAAGLKGVLVRTGKFRPEHLDAADGDPDAIVDSIVEVPHLFGL